MSIHILDLHGVDPLLFRDGRPFAAELGAQAATSLPVPYPGVVAGAVRTMVGSRLNWDWDSDGPARAKGLPVHGPLICLGDKLLVNAPADAVIIEEEQAQKDDQDNEDQVVKPRKRMTLRPRPLAPGEGCNVPEGMLPLAVTSEDKPARGYAFWPWNEVMNWLAGDEGAGTRPLPDSFPNIGKPTTEERIHVKIGAGGVAEDGMLFSTSSVVPWEPSRETGEAEPKRWGYRVRLDASGLGNAPEINGPLFLGGERRVAIAVERETGAWPTAPDTLRNQLKGARGVRMLLVTPAIFQRGWKADWMEGGCPPGLSGVKLTLKSACVPRREAVSGWDYQSRGPKAVRWLVPAGSVYFFELEGDPSALAESGWLIPVSDNEQDRLDGYGLAVWGIWNNEGVNG